MRRIAIPRRRALQGFALGTLGVAGAALVGCSSSNSKKNAATAAATSTSVGAPAGTAAPRASGTPAPAAAAGSATRPAGTPSARRPGPPQGTLKVATVSFGTQSIDPFAQNVGQAIPYALWEGFYKWAYNTGKSEPSLATGFESPDPATFNFKLRPNVKFWDGSPVTAGDFLWSYDAVTSQTPPNPGGTSLKGQVDSVTSPDPSTITVKLKKPSVLAMLEIGVNGAATSRGWPVASKAYFDKVGQDAFKANPMCTGPWKLGQNVSGQFVEFQANEQYWNADLVPRIKTMRMDVVAETATRVARLKTGEAHLIDSIGGATVEELQKEKGIQIIDEPSVSMIQLYFFDLDQPPWNDIRVRQAMTLAVDQDAIVKGLLKFGSPSQGVLLLPKSDGIDMSQFKPRPFDPAQAKALVQQAGVNGLSFQLGLYDSPSYPLIPQVMQAIAGFYQAIGLKPNLYQEEAGTYTAKFPARSLHGTGMRTNNFFSAPSSVYAAELFIKPGQPFSYLDKAGLDSQIDAMEKAAGNTDAQNRAALAVHKKFYDDYDVVTYPYSDAIFAATDKLKGWQRLPGPYLVGLETADLVG